MQFLRHGFRKLSSDGYLYMRTYIRTDGQTESTKIINHTALHVVNEMAEQKNNGIDMYVVTIHPFYPVRPESSSVVSEAGK